jgi:phage-related minor tail protein
MADIASLGIKVTTQGVKEADQQLDNLGKTGTRVEQQTKKMAPAMQATAKSAKELQFATRGLPAQFTDIATSLAGGQRPLNVLLQQGGQLKDMFGGIGPALRAMGGYVAGLINPFTLAAAAIGVAGIAFAKAEGEVAEFNKAIILTGNYARTSADDLAGMAQELDRATSATAGKSAAVLAEVTATGRFTAEQIEQVSAAAIRMEEATGKAIGETVKEFVQLQRDPVDAILKLNDSQHFLTESTLEQIQTLVDQGREADAAAVAIKAYADTINTRSAEVTQNLTSWGTLWHDLKIGAREAFDEIVQGFRESDDFAKKALASASAFASTFGAVSGLFATAVQGSFAFESARAAQAKNKPNFSNVTHGGDTVVDSDAARRRMDAEKDFGRIVESHLTQQKRLESEIAHIRKVGREAGIDAAKIEEQVAAARAAAARTGGGGRSRTGRAISTRALPDFSKTAAQDAAKLAEQEDRATESFRDMAAMLAGPLAAAQRDHERTVERLNELAKESPEAAAGLTQALADEARQYAETTAQIKRHLDPLGEVLAAQRLELDMIGKSNAEREVMNALIAQGTDLRSADAQAALAQARANQAEAESRQQAIDLMDDFRRGAADALTDFVTGAKSAKDALKDFFDEMARQITQAIANQWIKQLFGAQGSDGSGTAGGGWLAALAGLFSGGGGFGGAGSPLARGGVLMDGSLTAFADGGIVSRATKFPMRDGRTGLMGEAGPEAILPLHRGADGKLGVRMEAANDDGRTLVQNFNTQFLMPERYNPQSQAQIDQNRDRVGRVAARRNGA